MINNVLVNKSLKDSTRSIPPLRMKKTALVTGASGGIGLELAQLLAQDQYDLILVDIREKELIGVKQQLQESWPILNIETITEDLSQDEAAEKVANDGYRAMQSGKTIAIPGIFNNFLVNANRFLSRGLITRLVRRLQEKNRSFLKK